MSDMSLAISSISASDFVNFLIDHFFHRSRSGLFLTVSAKKEIPNNPTSAVIHLAHNRAAGYIHRQSFQLENFYVSLRALRVNRALDFGNVRTCATLAFLSKHRLVKRIPT
ncbi:hypothetical protein BDI4_580010 [Burkholderia diffusa]|nr:hypothetical protein BDI4_580010 [Burkholderia diffusa]